MTNADYERLLLRAARATTVAEVDRIAQDLIRSTPHTDPDREAVGEALARYRVTLERSGPGREAVADA
jgi:hypothetical protein